LQRTFPLLPALLVAVHVLPAQSVALLNPAAFPCVSAAVLLLCNRMFAQQELQLESAPGLFQVHRVAIRDEEEEDVAAHFQQVRGFAALLLLLLLNLMLLACAAFEASPVLEGCHAVSI
jgi:hypothetical protein